MLLLSSPMKSSHTHTHSTSSHFLQSWDYTGPCMRVIWSMRDGGGEAGVSTLWEWEPHQVTPDTRWQAPSGLSDQKHLLKLLKANYFVCVRERDLTNHSSKSWGPLWSMDHQLGTSALESNDSGELQLYPSVAQSTCYVFHENVFHEPLKLINWRTKT